MERTSPPASPRRPHRPATAFTKLRASFEIRRTTPSERRAAAVIVFVFAVATSAADAFVGIAALGILGCGITFASECLTNDAAAARGALLLLLAFVTSILGGVLIRHGLVALTKSRGDEIEAALERYYAREGAFPAGLQRVRAHTVHRVDVVGRLRHATWRESASSPLDSACVRCQDPAGALR